MVEVGRTADGEFWVSERTRWQAAAGSDDGLQLTDVQDAVINALDAPTRDAICAVAIKRPENVGRPNAGYDRRVRFEATAMVAAHRKGLRLYTFRRTQLSIGGEAALALERQPSTPTGDEAREAMHAACSALGNL
jgi:hypothetical protein